MQAAQIKARHKLSYADCFAAALARKLDAILVTGDQEFSQLEDIVAIEWLTTRRRS
jgi:ribonuclease VapC